MKLCVALDMGDLISNLNLVNKLCGLDLWLKVGLRSYLRDGVKIIEEIRKIGDFKIFLDLKIHDIPNTMADACEEIATLGVDMINIHASAGVSAMNAVMQRLDALENKPLVLAVSALTSFSDDEFFGIYNKNIADTVLKMSQNAYDCGLDGMVCSIFESNMIKNATNSNFITLTPGIRPFGESSQDQARVADINTARAANSDFIVVGRPIYNAQNPYEICERILTIIDQ